MITANRTTIRLPRICLAAAFLITACAPISYSPRMLDTGAVPTAFLARDPSDRSLARLVAASGYSGEWPPAQWRLESLVLVALHFNPEIETARAHSRVAGAELESAAQRAPLGLQFAAEHHSRQIDADSPWSLGLVLELPFAAAGKRAARVERSALLADAAQLEIAASAWRVRAAVRDALIDIEASRGREEIVQRQLVARGEMHDLVAKRVAAGMLSARELGQEQTALAELEVALDAERGRGQQALAAMSRALGLPFGIAQKMQIADESLSARVDVPDASAVRAAALRNRLDIHQRLLDFGAADADVKLAVAAQYPEITLSPGYLWDQSDNVWSLAVGLLFPPGARGLAAVREAQARRMLAEQRFSALQMQVIAEAEQAAAQFDAARTRFSAAQQRTQISAAQFARVQRLFEAGAIDRVELTAARINSLGAQSAFLAARVEQHRALARLEDVMQRPLLAEFHRLPHQADAATELSK